MGVNLIMPSVKKSKRAYVMFKDTAKQLARRCKDARKELMASSKIDEDEGNSNTSRKASTHHKQHKHSAAH